MQGSSRRERGTNGKVKTRTAYIMFLAKRTFLVKLDFFMYETKIGKKC